MGSDTRQHNAPITANRECVTSGAGGGERQSTVQSLNNDEAVVWNDKAYAAVGGRGGVKSPRAKYMDDAERIGKQYGVSLKEILSTSRLKVVVKARHHAWVHIATAYPWISSSQLGRLFKRDHSTVLYALHKNGVKYGVGSFAWRQDLRIAAETGGNGGEVKPETQEN